MACSAKKMVELVSGLETLGGTILPFPVIEAQEIEDKQPLNKALASLQEYAWIIFTSAYGVSFFMQHLRRRGLETDLAKMPKICAIGPATAAALRDSGLEPALIPERYVAEGVLEALERYHGGPGHLDGCKILLSRAQEARELLPEALAAAGARVDVVPCYQTVQADINDALVERVREKPPDLCVFTSSSTIRNTIEILGREHGMRLLTESTVAVIGPITAGTAASFGKRAEIVPKENTVAGLLKAISEYYSSR